MKKNEITDLKTKTVDELSRLLLDFQSEVEKYSVEQASGKLKNTNAIRNKKKDIARVLTFISIKKSIEAEPKAAVVESSGEPKEDKHAE